MAIRTSDTVMINEFVYNVCTHAFKSAVIRDYVSSLKQDRKDTDSIVLFQNILYCL